MNHLIVGMGQVGSALSELLIDAGREFYKWDTNGVQEKPKTNLDIMHVCFPYSTEFINEVINYSREFNPKFTIIHSTIKPKTTEELNRIIGDVYYSPTRGQHSALVSDLKRYKKYIAPFLPYSLLNELTEFLTIVQVKNSIELELAKLLDTTQYGMNIAWAQEAERICKSLGVSHDFVRVFGHQTNEFYSLRPDIQPGFCGGHCVRQNIALLKSFYDSKFFDVFIESNRTKARELNQADVVDYGN